jgi:hypothetical protein
MSEAASALQTLAADYAKVLLRALDDVAAAGSAKMLPSLLPNPDDPNSPTITLTRNDLQLGMSLYQSGSIDPLSRISAAQHRQAEEISDRSPPCLSDDPLYATCLGAIAGSKLFEPLLDVATRFALFIVRFFPAAGPAFFEGVATVDLIGAAACQLRPVVLEGFKVQKPIPIPITQGTPTQGTVELRALSKSNFGSVDELMSYIESKMIKRLRLKTAKQLDDLLLQLRKHYLEPLRKKLADALKTPFPKLSAERQVFHCDLFHVTSKDPNKLQRFVDKDSDGLYGFAGRKPGLARIGIQPRWGSFIGVGKEDRELFIWEGKRALGPHSVEVPVDTLGSSSLRVFFSPVTVAKGNHSQTGGWQEKIDKINFVPKGFPITFGNAWVPPSMSFMGVWATQSVRKQDANTWVVSQEFGIPPASCCSQVNCNVSNDIGHADLRMGILLQAIQPQQVTLQIHMEGESEQGVVGSAVEFKVVPGGQAIFHALGNQSTSVTRRIPAGAFGELSTMQGYGNSCQPSRGKTKITIKMIPDQ